MTTSAVASGQPSPSGAGLRARQTRSLLTPQESIQHPAGSCRARAQHLSTHPRTLACGWPRPRPRCREQGLLCARASSQRSHRLLLNHFGASDTAFAPCAPQHGLTRSFGQIFPLSTWRTGNVLQSSGQTGAGVGSRAQHWAERSSLPMAGRGAAGLLSLPGFSSKGNISCSSRPCDRCRVKSFPLHAHGASPRVSPCTFRLRLGSTERCGVMVPSLFQPHISTMGPAAPLPGTANKAGAAPGSATRTDPT